MQSCKWVSMAPLQCNNPVNQANERQESWDPWRRFSGEIRCIRIMAEMEGERSLDGLWGQKGTQQDAFPFLFNHARLWADASSLPLFSMAGVGVEGGCRGGVNMGLWYLHPGILGLAGKVGVKSVWWCEINGKCINREPVHAPCRTLT